MPFEVQVQEAGKVLVASLVGQLDTRSAPQLEKALDQALAKGSTELLVDCAKLDFVTSAGLRVLLMTGKRLAGAGGKLALCALNPSVKEVFEISGFAKLFPIHPARESALEWLTSNVKAAKISHFADDLLAKKAGGALRKPEARAAGGADPAKVALAAELLQKKPR